MQQSIRLEYDPEANAWEVWDHRGLVFRTALVVVEARPQVGWKTWDVLPFPYDGVAVLAAVKVNPRRSFSDIACDLDAAEGAQDAQSRRVCDVEGKRDRGGAGKISGSCAP